MRKSTLRLYLPFLGLVAAQALLISFLPSTGGHRTQVAAGAGLTGTAAAAGDQAAAATGDAAAADAGGGGLGIASGGTGTIATGTKTGNAAVAVGEAGGSRAHCAGNKQFAILSQTIPPCVPKFAGDNGGA